MNASKIIILNSISMALGYFIGFTIFLYGIKIATKNHTKNLSNKQEIKCALIAIILTLIISGGVVLLLSSMLN